MIWRRLTAAEGRLVRTVFGGGIDIAKVRLAGAPWRGLAVTLGSVVWFPKAVAARTDFGDRAAGLDAWFVHEMAHVWQFQHRPLWTLKSWFITLLGGGYGPERSGYRYPADPDWRALNLEQQAEVVSDAYAAGLQAARGSEGERAALSACLRQAGLPCADPVPEA